MPKRSAPDPNLNILAVRLAARRAARLYAKGVGEGMVAKEAAALFDALCPGLPAPLARAGREMARATARAWRPRPAQAPVAEARPPEAIRAALLRPARPGEVPAAAPPEKSLSRPRQPAAQPAGGEYTRGRLRVIPGGMLAAG
jgi:hypothetical protein